jgi:hypothetical protein
MATVDEQLVEHIDEAYAMEQNVPRMRATSYELLERAATRRPQRSRVELATTSRRWQPGARNRGTRSWSSAQEAKKREEKIKTPVAAGTEVMTEGIDQ